MDLRILALLWALLFPIIMIVFGVCFAKRPPRNINFLYGYRTFRSMRNQDTWQFSHRYWGKLIRVFGWIFLPISVAVPLAVNAEVCLTAAGILFGLQLICLIVSIFLTERALNRAFHKDGSRR